MFKQLNQETPANTLELESVCAWMCVCSSIHPWGHTEWTEAVKYEWWKALDRLQLITCARAHTHTHARTHTHTHTHARTHTHSVPITLTELFPPSPNSWKCHRSPSSSHTFRSSAVKAVRAANRAMHYACVHKQRAHCLLACIGNPKWIQTSIKWTKTNEPHHKGNVFPFFLYCPFLHLLSS